jgi:hypothetical protein
MQAHTHAQAFTLGPGMRGKGALGFGGALHSVNGACKRHKKRIALCIHFSPIPFLNGGTQDLVMIA